MMLYMNLIGHRHILSHILKKRNWDMTGTGICETIFSNMLATVVEGYVLRFFFCFVYL